MDELGPEDVEANDRAQEAATDAAYQAALKAHEELALPTIISPERPRDSSVPLISEPIGGAPPRPLSIRSARSGKSSRSKRLSIMSVDSSMTVRPYDEDMPSDLPTSRGFDPNVAQAPRRVMSSVKSISSLRPPSIAGSQMSSSSTKSKTKSFFGFGSLKRSSTTSSSRTREDSVDSVSMDDKARSIRSVETSHSSSSSGSKSKRMSISFGAKAPPGRPVETDIGDATYVNYASGRTARRSPSVSSGSRTSPDNASFTQKPLTASGTKSILRRESRFDPNRRRTVSTSMEISDDGEKTLYAVRFANATRGLGLKRVAEDEAVKGGGDTHAMRWIGVGRGRYGNLTLMVRRFSSVYTYDL
jgi:hypothetical protein